MHPRNLLVLAAILHLLALVSWAGRPAPRGIQRGPDGKTIYFRLPEEDQVRARRLAGESASVLKQARAYQATLSALADDRLTLPQAASALRSRLESQHLAEQLLTHYPGRTDEERYCRAVIDHVRKGLADDPRRAEVVDRLEAELAGLFTLDRPAGTTRHS
jgi:hypothetical protein